jgi:hypothetical protein
MSRDVLPLTAAERDAVRGVQLAWGMVKRCAQCARLLRVARFQPAAETCEACRSDPSAALVTAELEAWWSVQKTRLRRAS